MLYPDISLIRFFYKNELDKVSGSVIEFGCDLGQNLRLFDRHGWECTGVDFPNNSRESFGSFSNWIRNPKYIEANLEYFDPSSLDSHYDVILFPNVLYYLSTKATSRLLNIANNLLSANGFIFSIDRLVDDYRFGKGTLVERNRFRMTIGETGEMDQTITFRTIEEVTELFKTHFNVDSRNIVSLQLKYQNIQNSCLISNSDVITYFRKT